MGRIEEGHYEGADGDCENDICVYMCLSDSSDGFSSIFTCQHLLNGSLYICTLYCILSIILRGKKNDACFLPSANRKISLVVSVLW